ncbi:hypothetical protein AXF42_Ash019547 [Apostasia shenzhenica]|uniref:Uncharacterized protein n=1 Tax=Apostasia shenzhenica TaxID=1088818 RepID=A0A2I0A0E7_9ASPA|nr:hypothetical protein AXF42_Ash019547 [Apostasia shenzhenica]
MPSLSSVVENRTPPPLRFLDHLPLPSSPHSLRKGRVLATFFGGGSGTFPIAFSLHFFQLASILHPLLSEACKIQGVFCAFLLSAAYSHLTGYSVRNRIGSFEPEPDRTRTESKVGLTSSGPDSEPDGTRSDPEPVGTGPHVIHFGVQYFFFLFLLRRRFGGHLCYHKSFKDCGYAIFLTILNGPNLFDVGMAMIVCGSTSKAECSASAAFSLPWLAEALRLALRFIEVLEFNDSPMNWGTDGSVPCFAWFAETTIYPRRSSGVIVPNWMEAPAEPVVMIVPLMFIDVPCLSWIIT